MRGLTSGFVLYNDHSCSDIGYVSCRDVHWPDFDDVIPDADLGKLHNACAVSCQQADSMLCDT